MLGENWKDDIYKIPRILGKEFFMEWGIQSDTIKVEKSVVAGAFFLTLFQYLHEASEWHVIHKFFHKLQII